MNDPLILSPPHLVTLSGMKEEAMLDDMQKVPLHRIAHGRTGDKGNCSNISVIAYRPAFFPILVEQVTVERVTTLFQARRPTAVRRYVLPKLDALNFVLEDVLDGGVNEALNLDSHGKTLAFFLLEIGVMVPTAWLDQAQRG